MVRFVHLKVLIVGLRSACVKRLGQNQGYFPFKGDDFPCKSTIYKRVCHDPARMCANEGGGRRGHPAVGVPRVSVTSPTDLLSGANFGNV